jgi:hypothetical protein
MKIVQSFWTKPFLQSDDALAGNRLNGGWVSREYNYYSWALSCLQLKKYYNEVEIVTDALGKEILIDKLKLPYTSVVTELNQLDSQHEALWALGKIHAYKIQQKPFLHVDNDIFIWQPFESRIRNAGLAAQNTETTTEGYMNTFNFILKNYNYVPDYIKELQGSRYIPCVNAGILGGSDTAFYQQYTDEVYSFLSKNDTVLKRSLDKVDVGYINVFFEQAIFYGLASKGQKKIQCLFPDAVNTPVEIGFMHLAEQNKGFVHSYAVFKRRRILYSMVEMKLRTLYPDHYKRIKQLINTYEL